MWALGPAGSPHPELQALWSPGHRNPGPSHSHPRAQPLTNLGLSSLPSFQYPSVCGHRLPLLLGTPSSGLQLLSEPAHSVPQLCPILGSKIRAFRPLPSLLSRDPFPYSPTMTYVPVSSLPNPEGHRSETQPFPSFALRSANPPSLFLFRTQVSQKPPCGT